MTTFEDKAKEILEAYSLIDPYELGEDKFQGHHNVTEALSALTQLHQQETLRLIGEDESLNRQSEYDKEHFGSVKSDTADWVSAVRMGTRNSFRAEQRTNLNNTEGDK